MQQKQRPAAAGAGGPEATVASVCVLQVLVMDGGSASGERWLLHDE